MAISRIASQDAKGTSTASTVSATYPAATTAGNLLIASVFCNTTTDISTITGWTKRQSQRAGAINVTMAVFDRVADGTETTVTASNTNTNARIHIYEYTGNANPLVIDGNNLNTNTSATTDPTASITTTNANDLIFASLATSVLVTAPSATAPFNLRQVDTNIRLMDADQIVSATGTYAATFSWTTATATAGITIGYQAIAATTTQQTLTMTGVGS